MSAPDILVTLHQMVFRSEAWDRDTVEHMIRQIVAEREAHDAAIAQMRQQRDEARAGVYPRRCAEWSDDDGDALWWDTEMTGGEIAEPPSYVGTPTSSDWVFDETNLPHLLWVPLPKLASGSPKPEAQEGPEQ